MEEIVYSDELLAVAEQLGIGFITIDQHYNVVNFNRLAQPLVGDSPHRFRVNCPRDFFSHQVCPDCIKGKKSFCCLSRDGKHRHVFFLSRPADDHNDSLLKESERLRRVLLDHLNLSFLIINKEGLVERAHFVGDLSLLLGKRGFLDRLDRIFNREIGEKVAAKIRNMENERSRDMSHFRFELNSQILWLDIYISPIGQDKYFLNIDDKTGEHYLLERLDRLSEIEVSCLKVDEIGNRVGNLVSGILGYAEMALSKNDNPLVSDILDSIRKISSDSINLLNLMKDYSGRSSEGGSREGAAQEGASADRLSLNRAFVDVDRAVKNLEGNRELYHTVISDFIHDYSDISVRLTKAFREVPKETHRLVHSIKGVAGIIGAFTLQNEANVLEGFLRKEEWDEAEQMIPSFLATLGHVLNELKKMERESSSGDGEGREELSELILDSHQKELLKENLVLAEAGDYNGLMENLQQYSTFDWGSDWNRAVLSLRELVETIDFDGAWNAIRTLLR
ncbi:MAG: Hpt domain-containing protein [Spirochaetales bacterium]|nr:Hpt domain-containing protein [Spirochaetales bacterium]